MRRIDEPNVTSAQEAAARTLGKRKLLVLVLALWVCAICAHALADASPVDGPAILQTLSTTPAANLKPEAARLTKANPEQSRLLALDLIFYRWAAESWELDPGIDRLDDIAGALISASTDRSVIWAASELGPASWGAKALPSDSDDETVKAITDARHKLRTAKGIETSSPSKSIENLLACESMLHNLRMEVSAAFVDTRLGERHLYATRRYRDAELFYGRARSILSAYDMRSQLARVYQDLGRLDEEAGRYDSARDNYVHSAEKWLAAGRGDLCGRQYVNAGLALHKLGKDRAFAQMLRGLDYSRNYANTKWGSYESHAQLLLEVAGFCINNGRNDEARSLLTEPSLDTKTYDPLLRARILASLSQVCRLTGQGPRANQATTERTKILSRLAQTGVDAAVKLAKPSIPTEERVRLLRVTETGAAANAALERYQLAIDTLNSSAAGYEAMKLTDDRIRVLRRLADNQDSIGDHHGAVVSRTLAATIARETSRFDIAIQILRDIQSSAKASGDPNTGLESLQEAIDVAKISSDLRTRADLFFERATILMTLGRHASAADDLSQAAAIYVDQVGDLWAAANSVAKLAQVTAASNQTPQAIGMLSGMVQRIEQWANEEGVNPAAEPDHAAILVDLYTQLVVLEVRESRRDEAIGSLRTAHQYTWFSDLSARLRSTNDKSVIVLLDSVPPDTQAPVEEPGKPQKIAVGYPTVIAKVPAFSSVPTRSRTLGGPVIDAVSIFTDRAKLPADLAIVSYAIEDTDVFILLATKRSATVWKIAGAGDKVIENVQEFRSVVIDIEKSVSAGMALPPVTNWTDPKVTAMLMPLFAIEDTLFEPIAADLAAEKITSLVFALPDKLASIPFHALPREVKGKPGAVSFILQSYTTSYITANTFGRLVSPWAGLISPRKENVAIFPNSALPGAAAEARAISACFPGSRTFTNATTDMFVQQCSASGIVHIATHHATDPDPANMSITLGPAGVIRLADFMRITNPGMRLAVLSACDGIGSTDAEATTTTHVAEAFTRLARFPTFVGGLWKVSDKGSTRLMTGFYQGLARTGQKARSLRLAQESMVKSANGEYAHPFYWASFSLYGDPR